MGRELEGGDQGSPSVPQRAGVQGAIPKYAEGDLPSWTRSGYSTCRHHSIVSEHAPCSAYLSEVQGINVGANTVPIYSRLCAYQAVMWRS